MATGHADAEEMARLMRHRDSLIGLLLHLTQVVHYTPERCRTCAEVFSELGDAELAAKGEG